MGERAKKVKGPSAELEDRSRYAHYYRYCQHPNFVKKEALKYKIRKSLADFEKDELLFDQGLYYQRVYIFAKNEPKEKFFFEKHENFEVELGLEEEESAGDEDLEDFGLSYSDVESEHSILLTVEKLNNVIKKPHKVQEKKLQRKIGNFASKFELKLQELAEECHKQSITGNRINGLFVCMGESFTFLLIEGCEDIVGHFMVELNRCSADFWIRNRVFFLEDLINRTLFDKIEKFECEAVNVNEKFPPSVLDDAEIMGQQHFDIKNRLFTLCEQLSINLKKSSTAFDSLSDSLHNSAHEDYQASIDDFKRYLPEVQRMELVLQCSRFYRTLADYVKIYGVIPHQRDEDSFHWPLPFDYTPLGIFQRDEFDVNLTFTDYGKGNELDVTEDSRSGEAPSGEVNA